LCRDATAEEKPATCRTAEQKAIKAGWPRVRVTFARGCLTAAGEEHDVEPVYHVRLVALANEDGTPILTKTGKQAHKEEKTDQLVIMESVVLRIDFDSTHWVRGVWERCVSKPTDWKFYRAWTHQKVLKSVDMNRLIEKGPPK
jgi:hypothetical protein